MYMFMKNVTCDIVLYVAFYLFVKKGLLIYRLCFEVDMPNFLKLYCIKYNNTISTYRVRHAYYPNQPFVFM